MIQIIGTRQSGRTTQLIRLCKRLNDENGYNDTIIMVTSQARALEIMKIAKEIGCDDIPFPSIPSGIIHQHTTLYKRVLIDDMEYFVQQMLGSWELAGYAIQGPEMTTEFGVRSWISEREVNP
ncbi:MAG: hypothetical protein IKH20_11790 [Clostridiales bacterium]|nr:hypothetical protein [Clostridiales bacterium]